MIVVTGYKTKLLKKVFFFCGNWMFLMFLPLIWLHLNLNFSHHKISVGVLRLVACYHFT